MSQVAFALGTTTGARLLGHDYWGTITGRLGIRRWIHRPKMNWSFVESLENQPTPAKPHGSDDASVSAEPTTTVHAEIYHQVRSLIALRKSIPALAGQEMDLFETGNPHVLGYVRRNDGDRLIVLANFSDQYQTVDSNFVRTVGFSRLYHDCIGEKLLNLSAPVQLEPYQLLWLQRG